MKCYNLSRSEARDFSFYLDPEKNAWISIMEPDGENFTRSHTTNQYLDKCPNLKTKFWDVCHATPFIGEHEGMTEVGKCAFPITEEQVKEIYAFIMEHKDKNFYINCAAGKCRSGAICNFLQDMLQYDWDENLKRRADPNSYVRARLIEVFFRNGGRPPTKIIDKRLIILNEKKKG
jgi:hypothetical protein